MRTVLNVLLILAVTYALIVGLMYSFQERLLFLPSRALMATPADRGLDYQDLTIATDDDEQLHAWWISARDARGTLIFSHGNAGNISGRIDVARLFHDLGLNVLLYDYRGYGQSTGQASEDGLYRDIEAVWRYATDTRGLAPERLVLFGRSLGGAPSAYLATRETPAALVLDSAFTSVPDVAAHHYPFLPVRQLASLSFGNEARLPDVTAPVIILHSPDDEVIPYSHGERLYEAANEPKAFLQLEGGHNEAFFRSERRYRTELAAFLDTHLPAR